MCQAGFRGVGRLGLRGLGRFRVHKFIVSSSLFRGAQPKVPCDNSWMQENPDKWEGYSFYTWESAIEKCVTVSYSMSTQPVSCMHCMNPGCACTCVHSKKLDSLVS